MPKKVLPGNYRHAEYILYHYAQYKAELEEIESDFVMVQPGHDCPIRGDLPSDTTGTAAIKMAADKRIQYLRSTIQAVNQTLFELTERPEGASVAAMIIFIYWKKTHSLTAAAVDVGYSYTHARRLREAFIKQLIKNLGWA